MTNLGSFLGATVKQGCCQNEEEERKVGIPQSPTEPETHVSPIWEIYMVKGNAGSKASAMIAQTSVPPLRNAEKHH